MSKTHHSFLRSDHGQYVRSPHGQKVIDLSTTTIDIGATGIFCLLRVDERASTEDFDNVYCLLVDPFTFETIAYGPFFLQPPYNAEFYQAISDLMIDGTPDRLWTYPEGAWGDRGGMYCGITRSVNGDILNGLQGWSPRSAPSGSHFVTWTNQLVTIDPLSFVAIPLASSKTEYDSGGAAVPAYMTIRGVGANRFYCGTAHGWNPSRGLFETHSGEEINQFPIPQYYDTAEPPTPPFAGFWLGNLNPNLSWGRQYPGGLAIGFGSRISILTGGNRLEQYDAGTLVRRTDLNLTTAITGNINAGGGANDILGVFAFSFRAEPSQYKFWTIDCTTGQSFGGFNPVISGLEQNRINFSVLSVCAY